MKNRTLYRLLVCGMFVALVAASGVAQSIAIKADVPFAYSIVNTTFSASECLVKELGGSSHILLFRGAEGVKFAMARPEDRAGMPQSKLVFHKYGDQYLLSEVWSAASDRVWVIPTASRERKLAKNGPPQILAVLATPTPANGN